MHPARFTPLAEADLKEAFEYYERKKFELGIEFMGKVRQTVDRIEEDPLMFPVVLDGIRRANVSRFPTASGIALNRMRASLLLA